MLGLPDEDDDADVRRELLVKLLVEHDDGEAEDVE